MHPIAALNSFHLTLSNPFIDWDRGVEVLTQYLEFDLYSIEGIGDTGFLSRRLLDRKAFEIFKCFIEQAESNSYQEVCLKAVTFASCFDRHEFNQNEDLACELLTELASRNIGVQEASNGLQWMKRTKNQTKMFEGITSCLRYFSNTTPGSYQDVRIQEHIERLENALAITASKR